ncbi:glycosyltransferase [Roseobacter weihaiensis]|uniref:glycosyltransferase n=1 Tax=Roseobacter weihaiensis TaxID=2763262 RepID=UPI001D0A6B52|nr:glycosyltransferase [Roseobacter sp. H9]
MHFINISDLAGPTWRFLEPLSTDPQVSWSMHYGRPRNWFEKSVPRPALGRYRAAWMAAHAARGRTDAVLVSHLPRVSAATNRARRWLCPDTPHIAFAFNFTDLPQGRDRARLTRGLRGIDAYVVFSRFEQAQYPAYFDLPPDRVHYLPWTMEPPLPGPDSPVTGSTPYLCSIGGEGRDYALLAQAMAALPRQRMVIVARPYSVAGIAFPDNVEVFTNLPKQQTWRVAADSLGLVVPLQSDQTACGHITIIGGQLLGLPLLVTRSRGVEDYITEGQTGLLMAAGDKAGMIKALRHLAEDRPAAQALGQAARIKARQDNSPAVWLEYFNAVARTGF